MSVSVSRSLARLSRARTINLQCQSLSLRRAFLLRSVCLSLHLTVESFAIRWPTRSQNRSTIIVKINRKSIPEIPRGTQNRMKIGQEAQRSLERAGEATRVLKSCAGQHSGTHLSVEIVFLTFSSLKVWDRDVAFPLFGSFLRPNRGQKIN